MIPRQTRPADASCRRSITRRLCDAARAFGAAFTAAVLLTLLASFSSAAMAQAGYVHAMSGTAMAQKSGERTPLKVGDTFSAGTSFSTGETGRVVLKFADGQVLVLGPDSIMRVDRYQYDARNIKASSFALGLLDGSMRFIAGSIASQNREAARIGAGDSTITLLGSGSTDFTVVVDSKAAGGEAGVAIVTSGEIAVRTPYGPIRQIAADQAVPWRPQGGEPPPPVPLAAMPAVIQAAVAALRVAGLPANTPLAVETAATAARATAAVAAVSRGQAGYVEAALGPVSAQGSFDRISLKAGDRFDAGTSFDVGANGRAVLKLADGQIIVLGANSTARLDQYRFEPRDTKGSGLAIELLAGEMRFLGGVIASENPAAVRVTAGASPIRIVGLGGVDFTVAVYAGFQDGVGMAVVTAGQISLRTPAGLISLDATNPAAYLGLGQTRVSSLPVAAGFTLVQAVVALQGMTLPPNTPVVVESAARAASAAAAASQAQSAAAANPGNTQLAANARDAARLATAAAQSASADAQALIAGILDTALAELPATGAGAPPAAALAAAPAPLSLDLSPFPTSAFPGIPLAASLTPAIVGCRGDSPC